MGTKRLANSAAVAKSFVSALPAEIEDDGADLFSHEAAQSGVEFQQLRPAQIARTQIADVAIDDLAVKRRGRDSRAGLGGEEPDPAPEMIENAGEGGPLQFRFAERGGIEVMLAQKREGSLQIGRREGLELGGRSGLGRGRGRLAAERAAKENR